MSIQSSPSGSQKMRVFSPVILFHDHQYHKDGSGELQRVHVPCGDPHYGPSIELHKKRIQRMLEYNGRFWADIMTLSREHPTSPVPSLASSPTPPLIPQELPSPSSRASPLPPLADEPKEDETQYRRKLPRRRMSSHYGPVMSAPSPPYTSPHSSPLSTSTPHPEAGPRNKKLHTNGPKRRRGNLPKPVTTILREWLSSHKKHPYPTEEEKMALARQTNLTLNQISNWFINARRRILQPMLAQEQHDHDDDEDDSGNDMMPYTDASISGRRSRKRGMSDASLKQPSYVVKRRTVSSTRRR